jgi:hypothetical protein
MVLDHISKTERTPPGSRLSERLAFLKKPCISDSPMGSSGTVSTAASSTCPSITSPESSGKNISSSTGHASIDHCDAVEGGGEMFAADQVASGKVPKIPKNSKNALSPGSEHTAGGHRMSLGMISNHGTLKSAGTGLKKKVIKVRASALSGKNPSDVDLKHLEQVIKNYESSQQPNDDDSSIISGRRSVRPSRPGRRLSGVQENRKRSLSRRRRSVSRGPVSPMPEEDNDAAEEVTFAVKDPSTSPALRRRSKSRGRHEGATSPKIQEIMMSPDNDSAPHRLRSHSRGRDHAAIDDVKERREEMQRSHSRGRPVTSEVEKQRGKARSLSRPRPVGEENLDFGAVRPVSSNTACSLSPSKQLKMILQAKKSAKSELNFTSMSEEVAEKVLNTGIISREQLEQLLVAGFRVSED